MLKNILLVVAILFLGWVALGLLGSVFKLAFVLVRLAAGVGLVVLIVWLIKNNFRSPRSGDRL